MSKRRWALLVVILSVAAWVLWVRFHLVAVDGTPVPGIPRWIRCWSFYESAGRNGDLPCPAVR